MKPTIAKNELSDKADLYAELRSYLSAAIAECDEALLQAASSQSPFSATRLHLRGQREGLVAVLNYLGSLTRL